MIEEKIHKALSDGVTLVNTRVYPLTMPQDTKKPCVVYQVIGDLDRDCMLGDTWANTVMIQIDTFAPSYKESILIRDQVKEAMRKAFKVSSVNTLSLYENITVKYRQMVNMTINAYKEYTPVVPPTTLTMDSTLVTIDSTQFTL